jgi:hypothetical protein
MILIVKHFVLFVVTFSKVVKFEPQIYEVSICFVGCLVRIRCLFKMAYNGLGLGEGGDFHHKN